MGEEIAAKTTAETTALGLDHGAAWEARGRGTSKTLLVSGQPGSVQALRLIVGDVASEETGTARGRAGSAGWGRYSKDDRRQGSDAAGRHRITSIYQT